RGRTGVVQVTGPDAARISHELITYDAALAPRHATLTRVGLSSRASLVDANPAHAHDAIDHAVVTFFPTPQSYTGDDVVELSAHGSPVVLHAIVAEAIAAGARLAEPGELPPRAFLNGRLH